MNIRNVATIITKPRIITPTVFLAVGTGKTLLDYEKSKPDNKKRLLAKNTAMLCGSLAGFLAMNPVSRLICKMPSSPKTIINSTRYIATQSIAGVLNTFAGILGAVIANEFIHKLLLNKSCFSKKPIADNNLKNTPEQQKNTGLFAQSNVFKNFNYVNQPAQYTAGALLSLPTVSAFTTAPMIALTGISVANTKGYNNKIKRTAKELITNSLIPTVLVSATSLLVNKKKGYIKYPALLSALTTGSFIGNILAKRYQDKLFETIDSIDFQNINFKRTFRARPSQECSKQL